MEKDEPGSCENNFYAEKKKAPEKGAFFFFAAYAEARVLLQHADDDFHGSVPCFS
jgi:hypothetical protein